MIVDLGQRCHGGKIFLTFPVSFENRVINMVLASSQESKVGPKLKLILE